MTDDKKINELRLALMLARSVLDHAYQKGHEGSCDGPMGRCDGICEDNAYVSKVIKAVDEAIGHRPAFHPPTL